MSRNSETTVKHAMAVVNVRGLYRGCSECQSNELVWPPRATREERVWERNEESKVTDKELQSTAHKQNLQGLHKHREHVIARPSQSTRALCPHSTLPWSTPPPKHPSPRAPHPQSNPPLEHPTSKATFP